jgi:hypothetical protein
MYTYQLGRRFRGDPGKLTRERANLDPVIDLGIGFGNQLGVHFGTDLNLDLDLGIDFGVEPATGRRFSSGFRQQPFYELLAPAG